MTIFYPSMELRQADDELEYQQVASAMEFVKTGHYATDRILKALDPVIKLLATELRLEERYKQQAPMMAQAAQNAMYQLFAMQNYRPAAIVPVGWAEWYAIGDGAV